MILAFDLSMSSTGYSVFGDDGEFMLTGHIETNGKESTPLRLNTIAKQLKKLKKQYRPSLILIERGFYRFAESTKQVFRVHGITNLIFYDVEQEEIHATSVRKIVAGKGNMTKDEFQEFIETRYPNVEFYNNDEVDSFALGVAYFMRKEE